jgi:hypothetical protein
VPEACFSKKLTDGLGPQNQEASQVYVCLPSINLAKSDPYYSLKFFFVKALRYNDFNEATICFQPMPRCSLEFEPSILII